MKIWIYVEGQSDSIALNALWKKWRDNLRKAGWGIHIIPLENKAKFFQRIGARAVQKLMEDTRDFVVGLPDYYPNQPYAGGRYPHNTLQELLDLQSRLVRNALNQKGLDQNYMERFHPSAFKHDMEVLLLAAHEQLRNHLRTGDQLGHWRYPVEEQDQNQPPKRVVEDLYRRYKRRAYRDTTDAFAVLSRVDNITQILHFNTGQLNCPVFKNMLDWIGKKTGVPAC